MEPPRCRAECPLAVMVVLVLLGLLRAPPAVAQRCTREPEGKFGRPHPKMPGSGGYGIEMSGNHHEYDPGERYEVKLGSTQKRLLRKFIGFYLTVEPAVPVDYIMSQRVGRFQRSDSLSVRFTDECPNTVLHTSDALKSYVPVVWVAPPPGSGCVVFRATVIERHDVWFKDDGALSYKLCERVRENHDEQPLSLDTCCACNEAKYEVTFEGLWSRNTHPNDFPIDRTAAAFSDIVGASHSAGFHIWREDGMASQGVRQVAEWGNTKKLENELKKNSSEIRTIIKARGLEYPNLQGRTFAVFRVDRRHHQASLLSRLKPSPDWLVGVSAMELCLHNCSWAERRVLNLRPMDAGTMNGNSYLGSYTMSNPAQKIRRITSKWPVDSPFYDVTGGEIPPLARLVFKRQRTYERQCADDRAGPARLTRSDCATTSWSAWSGCNVTCGKGYQSRHRYYRNRMHAGISHCHVALEETSQCSASIPCSGDFDFGGGGRQQQNSIDCSLDSWSRWGACSTSCGPGVRMRNRKFKSRLGRKWCSEKTTETQDCSSHHAPCESPEVLPPGCEVLPWSDWSPCSVSCGESGVRVRTRKFYPRDSSSAPQCNDVSLNNRMVCHPERTSCQLADSEAVAVCRLPVEVGDCRYSFQRWHYSEQQGRCVSFTFSGCRGNDNNFHTLAACEETCEAVLRPVGNFGAPYTSADGGGRGGAYGLPNEAGQYGSSHYALAGGGIAEPADISRHSEPLSSSQVINPLLASSSRSQLSECAVGAWSAWSPCSASCGSGTQVRRRRPLQPERANTAGCGRRRLVKHRHCRWLPLC